MPVFIDSSDYLRMIQLLYIANNTESFNFRDITRGDIFYRDKKDSLVDIIAYCLMPNHFHIAVKSKTSHQNDTGLSKFMHKLCTAYSMYFNQKHKHSGTIWEGSYNDKISNQELLYMETLFDYIHLNPYALASPNLTKEERKLRRREAIEYSKNYPYSSFKDYYFPEAYRKERAILNKTEYNLWKKLLRLHLGSESALVEMFGPREEVCSSRRQKASLRNHSHK